MVCAFGSYLSTSFMLQGSEYIYLHFLLTILAFTFKFSYTWNLVIFSLRGRNLVLKISIYKIITRVFIKQMIISMLICTADL